MENYCRIQLIRKAQVIEPIVEASGISSEFLGPNYATRCHLKAKINDLKVLPFYRGLNHLEEILILIKDLISIYEADQIKIFNSINPWDNAMDTKISWYNKSYTQKMNSLKNIFSKTKLVNTYDHIFLFPEVSEKGRFHFHGIIFMNDSRNLWFMRQTLNKAYSNRPTSRVNTKAIIIEPFTESFLNNIDDNKELKNKHKGIDYITKDYGYMKTQGYTPIIMTGGKKIVFKNKNRNSVKIDVIFSDLDKNINNV